MKRERERQTGHDGRGGGWWWWRKKQPSPGSVVDCLLPIRTPLHSSLLRPPIYPRKETPPKGCGNRSIGPKRATYVPSSGPFVLLDTFFLDQSLASTASQAKVRIGSLPTRTTASCNSPCSASSFSPRHFRPWTKMRRQAQVRVYFFKQNYSDYACYSFYLSSPLLDLRSWRRG